MKGKTVMDSDDKVILTIVLLLAFMVLLLTVVSNWRWRLNKKDFYKTEQEYIQAGYVQRAVPTEYETIWIKDPNAK